MAMAMVIINCIILAIGNCGGPLIMRLYYNNGGKRIWFSSFLQTAGFPVILLPLLFFYLKRRRTDAKTSFFLMKPRLLMASILVGLLSGFDNYLYAYGLAYLPVSTAALIIASQLAFIAVFSFFMVKHKFTPFTINSVVLLTVGAAVLGIHTEADKPVHESHKQYIMGFAMTAGAAIMYAFILPLVELFYKKARQPITYTLVLEALPVEAEKFKLGKSMFYLVVIVSAVIWQGFFLGAIGVISCASSLVSGIMISVLLPITEVLAVIIFHEKFPPEKGVALGLSLWGFVSYFYGEIKSAKEAKQTPEIETPRLPDP